MKKIIIILIVIFVGMEALGWLAFRSSKKEPTQPVAVSEQIKNTSAAQSNSSDSSAKPIVNPKPDSKDIQTSGDTAVINNGNAGNFPPPSVETADGVVVRTIHMGVRQWAWDPSQLNVKYGEKVILIMHNADVAHSLSIPDLDVKQQIPEEGAVITFVANKRGTFDFFCDTPCGKGHSKMQGKITVL